MDNGVIGTMNANWTNYGSEDNSTSIYGTLGAMHIYKDPNHSVVVEKGPNEKEYYDTDAIQTNDNQTASGIIDMFVDYIVKDAPAITAEDVLPAMRGIFACEQSAEQGGLLISTKKEG